MAETVSESVIQLEPVYDNQLTDKELLGKGYYGVTYKATYASRLGSFPVVIKVSKRRFEIEELRALEQLPESEHAVPAFGICMDFSAPGSSTDRPAVVLRYLEGGDLSRYARRPPTPLTEIHALSLVIDMARAVQHVHANSFIHRDIALRNFLLRDHSASHVVLSDFGLARRVGAAKESELEEEAGAADAPTTPAADDDESADVYEASSGVALPVWWTAPEALKENRHSRSSDIWMLGVAIWELWASRIYSRPFDTVAKSLSELLAKIDAAEGCILPLANAEAGWEMPASLAGLVRQCCAKEVEGRPTAAMVVALAQELLGQAAERRQTAIAKGEAASADSNRIDADDPIYGGYLIRQKTSGLATTSDAYAAPASADDSSAAATDATQEDTAMAYVGMASRGGRLWGRYEIDATFMPAQKLLRMETRFVSLNPKSVPSYSKSQLFNWDNGQITRRPDESNWWTGTCARPGKKCSIINYYNDEIILVPAE